MAVPVPCGGAGRRPSVSTQLGLLGEGILVLIAKSDVKHVSSVTHEGKVVVMLTVTTGTGTELWYTVKQDGYEDTAVKDGAGGLGWEDPRRLVLPSEPHEDASVVEKERGAENGRPLLRSVYDSVGLTADAPVQLVSHDGHCYVFRQSLRDTVLVDRFVLDGLKNELTPKLEVRYKRSRQRLAPSRASKVNSSGQLESQDSLDFRDVDQAPFTEPTTELMTLSVRLGWFGVVVVPTNEQDAYRWHIFSSLTTSSVDVLSVRAGESQMFDVQDSWSRTVDPVTDEARYSTVPGLVERHIQLRSRDLEVMDATAGPAVVRYAVQHEQQTQNGPQLVTDSSRVLLALPTTLGTAVLTFAIAGDGRLSQIDAAGTSRLLRSTSHDVLLPLDLLEHVRPVGDSSPTPAGSVVGLRRSEDDDNPDRLVVDVAGTDAEALGGVRGGDTVRISRTSSHDGLHRVVEADKACFVIDTTSRDVTLGDWEKLEAETTGLVFDGMLTGYEKTSDGRLRVRAVNHGLSVGESVQITGDPDYAGEYPVLARDSKGFTVERIWAEAEGVDVALESRRRRGLVLDGSHDWIEAAFSDAVNLSAGFTVEAWVQLSGRADQTILSTRSELVSDGARVDVANATVLTLETRDGRLGLAVTRPLLGRTSALRVVADVPLPTDAWVHVGATFDGAELHLLQDGQVRATVTAAELDHKADLAQDAVIARLEADVQQSAGGAPDGSMATDPARARLDELEKLLKQVPPGFRLGVGGVRLGAGPRVADDGTAQDGLLRGRLADVRLWRTARDAQAVSDAMFLQLTGRETGLVGYWRLGGVATRDDGSSQVVDFSVGANHGSVRGAPYAGGVSVARTLRDGTTTATRLGNDDLVAVREGGVYVERFEFRTDVPLSPADVDGKQTPIFVPSVWGRSSRTARNRIPIQPLQAVFELTPLADGWQAATCRYLVPDGVRLVRGFEVEDVAGSWTELELRRYSLQLVSDTVTLFTLDEKATLPLLDAETPPPPGLLPELAGVEADEAREATRAQELTRLLNDTGDAAVRADTEARRDRQRGLVTALRSTRDQAQAAKEAAWGNPVNFWFRISTEGQPDWHVHAHEDQRVIEQSREPVTDRDRWRLVQVDATWWRILNKATGLCADAEDSGGIHQQDVQPGNNHQHWKWWAGPPGYVVFFNDHQQKVVEAPQRGFGMIVSPDRASADQHCRMIIDGEAVNDVPSNTQSALDAANRDLSTAEAELAHLDAAADASSAQRAAWQTELQQVLERLATAQRRIASLTTTYLGAVAASGRAAQTMPDLVGQKDPNGLTTQAALLPALLPAGPLHALESCTGRVTLSYVDADGRLRQRHYDTAYDADGKGEEWLPEDDRTALALVAGGPAPSLPRGTGDGIGNQVTVELWARGGARLPLDTVLLGGLDADGRRRLRIQLPDAQGEVVWEAGLQQTGGSIDRLVHAADASSWRGSWNHWAFVKDADAGELRIHLNGAEWARSTPRTATGGERLTQPVGPLSQVSLGGLPGQPGTWEGSVCELRIWSVALDAREIEAHSMLGLSGDEPGLVAYYPMNEGAGDLARDHAGAGHHLALASAGWAACSAPVGRLAEPTTAAPGGRAVGTGPGVVCAEFSRVHVDARKVRSVLMNRCLAVPTPAGIRLLDGQRIDELQMTWIGNAQVKPTLVGYIEGPPPIPSENLTQEQDYNGATSVELVVSSDVAYSWTRSQDGSLGADAEVLIGAKSTTSAGVGVQTELEDIKSGGGGKLSFAYHWQNASTVGASQSLMSNDRLELRGSQETEPHFPALGKRFQPKSIGYALVTSGLADVFVSKLRRSGRMVGTQVLPVDGVPLDVNTITFLINPAYTMAGSLDGLTGSRATSDRVFGDVPQMRSQYGSLFPASYFRIAEAYALKEKIQLQDSAHEAYFNQFVAGEVDETSLTRQADEGGRDLPIALPSSLDQQVSDAEAELEELKKATPVDTGLVATKQRGLDELREKQSAARRAAQTERTAAAGKRQEEIDAHYTDLSAKAHATDSFAAWQTKMEVLAARAGRRNIVNTYVWDGDGGLHAEEQQFASTVEHSVGGSFDLGAAIGGQGHFAVLKAMVELNAYATMSLTQTMSKTSSSTKGLELHVDLGGVESRGITDFRDQPVLPGEKVDRYRFMSFYLEPTADHWHDFFDHVVDPEWLASNDEEARALRETASMQPNKVWRVLHRVTYVERPALMGFGRDVAPENQTVDDIRSLREQVAQLQGTVATLQRDLNDKLDQLLVARSSKDGR